jgi:cyanuric acid amidohydrolase
MSIAVFRFEMSGPGDCSALLRILKAIDVETVSRVAIIAKTEGPATVNDFGRALAMQAIRAALGQAGVTAPAQVILSMGCEGIISPGGYCLVDSRDAAAGIDGLAMGMASSEPMTPADLVNDQHIEATRATVERAIEDAGIAVDQVAVVFAKSPLLTHAMAVGLSAEQQRRANRSSSARAAAALGIGLALGEIDANLACSAAIDESPALYSHRAMVFSGTETDRVEIIVLGNRGSGPKPVRSGLFADLIDLDGMARIVAGNVTDPIGAVRRMTSNDAIAAVFMKAGFASDGKMRGNRTTVFASDLEPDKHMRAVASGVIGALLGDTRMFVSGGAEHQAPAGGGVLAVIFNNPVHHD